MDDVHVGSGLRPEWTRLEAIQRSVDGFSHATLESLPVETSWRCLELGAGAGSIAYWLAERCPAGRVTAVDIDVRHLDGSARPNLVVEQADVTADDFAPGLFDLVHGRFLFCHLPVRTELVSRAVEWLAPGGWLVLEEPYHLPAHDSPFAAAERVLAAYQTWCRHQGADMTWARRMPSLFARSGLTDVGFSGNVGCLGGDGTDRWLPLIRQAEPDLLADGLVEEDDIVRFHALLEDPTLVDIPQVTVAAWGRRPADGN